MNNKLFNLTCPQKAILSMEQFYPNTSMNTISGKISIHTKVDFSLLTEAIHIFVKNTDNIRYQLHMENDVVKQYKKKYQPFSIDHIKLNSENEAAICEQIAKKTFPLYDSPLYYFATFEKEDLTGGFFVCVHHMIADAWAMSMLISSIISIYSQLIKKESVVLDDNHSFPYTHFIEQESSYLQSSKYKQDEAFWEELFQENIFENSYSGTSMPPFGCEASRIEFKLSKKMTSKIVDFCKQIKVSPFTFLLFAMGIYESKIKQTDQIVLSAPILNRSSQKDKHTFGLFVNNMVFKLDMKDSISFFDAITTLNKTQFSYLRHQKYPLQNLITNLKNKFNVKGNIYNTSVSYQNARVNHCQDNVTYDSQWLFSGFSSIPLLFHIYDMDDTSRFSFIYDYQNNVYQPAQIKDIHNRLLHICEQVIENPNILLKDIELATKEERDTILNQFNQTAADYDFDKTILDLWEEQVSCHPNKTVIICGDKKISYQELEELSNQFAAFLQKKYHVEKGRNLSVVLERSIDLIVVTLAILKCGCSYVLIDPSHPMERQKYMIQNSNSQYVISNLPFEIENLIVWDCNSCLKEPLNYKRVKLSSDYPMYLLYTSGSTGAPKAVTVTHRNFHNYLLGISQVVDYSEEKKVLSMASISFDVFGYELWVTLLNGLTLVLSTRRRTK